jgi:serine kinase of HPr protein (carbohydrate metabolism regulator)
MSPLSVHASAVVVGEAGVLVRGPSGAGKSALCLALIDEANRRGCFGALVADDRVFLTTAHGRLIAAPAAGFEGMIEQRGAGIVRRPHAARAVLRLAVDLAPAGESPPRWQDEAAQTVEIAGVTLARLRLDLRLGPHYAAALIFPRVVMSDKSTPAANFA